MAKERKELTARQERFAREYVACGCGKASAIAAGYKAHSAESTSSRMIRNVKVAARIAELQAKVAERLEITSDMIAQEYAKIAFSNIRDYLKFGPDGVKLKDHEEIPPDELAAIEMVSETITENGGSLKFKLYDKKSALDSLAKHLGMSVDKKEISGPGGSPVRVDLSGMTDEELELLLSKLKE